eukprot:scaffold7902_cov129-Cylindrotheca_fusiformis.AAC.3
MWKDGNDKWEQIGQTLAESDVLGSPVSLASSESILALGSFCDTEYGPTELVISLNKPLRVYTLVDNQWVVLADPVGSSLSQEVSLSSDGRTIAVGHQYLGGTATANRHHLVLHPAQHPWK